MEHDHLTKMQKEPRKPSALRVGIWRISNGIVAVFFSLCAILQHNDLDPELWIPIYSIASLLSLAIASNLELADGLVWRVMFGIESAYCLALSSYVIMYTTEETIALPHGLNPLHYEEGRELLGLAIILAWLTADLLYRPQKTSGSSSRMIESLLLILISALAILPLALYSVCQISGLSDHVRYCRLMCSSVG